MGTTISNAVNTVVTAAKGAVATVTPAVSFVGKHWKSFLIGGICVYAMVISITYFSLVASANAASAKSKLDAAAAEATITGLTANLAEAKANLVATAATAKQQQRLIEQSSADNKRLAANNSELDKQNRRLIEGQSAASGSNSEAIDLNGRAIRIVNDLINSSP